MSLGMDRRERQLRKLLPELCERVKAMDVLPLLTCLRQPDRDSITAMVASKGNWEGMQELIDRLRRRSSWHPILIQALKRMEHDDLAEKLDNSVSRLQTDPGHTRPYEECNGAGVPLLSQTLSVEKSSGINTTTVSPFISTRPNVLNTLPERNNTHRAPEIPTPIQEIGEAGAQGAMGISITSPGGSSTDVNPLDGERGAVAMSEPCHTSHIPQSISPICKPDEEHGSQAYPSNQIPVKMSVPNNLNCERRSNSMQNVRNFNIATNSPTVRSCEENASQMPMEDGGPQVVMEELKFPSSTTGSAGESIRLRGPLSLSSQRLDSVMSEDSHWADSGRFNTAYVKSGKIDRIKDSTSTDSDDTFVKQPATIDQNANPNNLLGRAEVEIMSHPNNNGILKQAQTISGSNSLGSDYAMSDDIPRNLRTRHASLSERRGSLGRDIPSLYVDIDSAQSSDVAQSLPLTMPVVHRVEFGAMENFRTQFVRDFSFGIAPVIGMTLVAFLWRRFCNG